MRLLGRQACVGGVSFVLERGGASFPCRSNCHSSTSGFALGMGVRCGGGAGGGLCMDGSEATVENTIRTDPFDHLCFVTVAHGRVRESWQSARGPLL